MQTLEIKPEDISLMRKLLPAICLVIPWEVYSYSNYSSGWGIKFSVFYANFDVTYGTLLVDIFRQMTLLSLGGFLPSVRTLAWASGAFLCTALAIYELVKENMDLKIRTRTTAHILITCGILTAISSLAVWNSSFRTLPIAPFFLTAFGYLLLRWENQEVPANMDA